MPHSGSRMLKAYYMKATAEQAAVRLRQRNLSVRIEPQRAHVMGKPHCELTFALYVDYNDVREMARARSMIGG